MNKRLVILVSGEGGNLKFLYNAIKNGFLNSFEISNVIATKSCGATKFAELHEIPVGIVDFRDSLQLTEAISGASPDLVISLANQIIPSLVIENTNCEIVNLHYSLLPSFKGFIGANTLKHALDYGACISGATVHKVTEELDGGKPLCQVAFILNRESSETKLMNIMYKAGCIALVAYLLKTETQQLLKLVDSIEIDGNRLLIGPASKLPEISFEEQSVFWGS